MFVFRRHGLAAANYGGIYKRIGLRSETPRRRQLSKTLPGLTFTWAQRLKRVFRVDIETCRHCGGAVLQIHRESNGMDSSSPTHRHLGARLGGTEPPVRSEKESIPLLFDPQAALAAASNDGTWPSPAGQAMKSIRGCPMATCNPFRSIMITGSNVGSRFASRSSNPGNRFGR